MVWERTVLSRQAAARRQRRVCMVVFLGVSLFGSISGAVAI